MPNLAMFKNPLKYLDPDLEANDFKL